MKPDLHDRRNRGAAATEYVLVLIFVVLPIAALLPLFMNMIGNYGIRVLRPIGLPFP